MKPEAALIPGIAETTESKHKEGFLKAYRNKMDGEEEPALGDIKFRTQYHELDPEE